MDKPVDRQQRQRPRWRMPTIEVWGPFSIIPNTREARFSYWRERD